MCVVGVCGCFLGLLGVVVGGAGVVCFVVVFFICVYFLFCFFFNLWFGVDICLFFFLVFVLSWALACCCVCVWCALAGSRISFVSSLGRVDSCVVGHGFLVGVVLVFKVVLLLLKLGWWLGMGG